MIKKTMLITVLLPCVIIWGWLCLFGIITSILSNASYTNFFILMLCSCGLISLVILIESAIKYPCFEKKYAINAFTGIFLMLGGSIVIGLPIALLWASIPALILLSYASFIIYFYRKKTLNKQVKITPAAKSTASVGTAAPRQPLT